MSTDTDTPTRTRYRGYLTQQNAAAVADRLDSLLRDRRFTVVTVRPAANGAFPEVRTRQTLAAPAVAALFADANRLGVEWRRPAVRYLDEGRNDDFPAAARVGAADERSVPAARLDPLLRHLGGVGCMMTCR